MQYEKYENLSASSDKLEFGFESNGPKGSIKKVVQFTVTNHTDIYNLAFGNLNNDGSIDDETTNDNKDRNKILATVAAAIYEFTARYPDKTIFFCGSTAQRTRLYRMALSINLAELKKNFRIYGVLKGLDTFEKVPFRKEVDYYGFMIKRNKS
jgi:hypothetical protein